MMFINLVFITKTTKTGATRIKNLAFHGFYRNKKIPQQRNAEGFFSSLFTKLPTQREAHQHIIWRLNGIRNHIAIFPAKYELLVVQFFDIHAEAIKIN